MVGTVVCHTGSSEDGERILRRLKTFSPLLMDSIGTMPYTSAQKLVNDSYPKGLQNYWKIELHRGDKRRGHRGSTIYWEGNRNAAERPCPPHPSGPPWSPHSIPCNLLNFNPELPQGPQNCGLIRGMRDELSCPVTGESRRSLVGASPLASSCAGRWGRPGPRTKRNRDESRLLMAEAWGTRRDWSSAN